VSNLVPNDNYSGRDVFIRDRSAGLTRRVSVDSAGGEVAAFGTYSDNLVRFDDNVAYDVFRVQRFACP
jgi:hypothetical protein